MNAKHRAVNVVKRGKPGPFCLLSEIASAIEKAHQQGVREGAIAMAERAADIDIHLSPKERTNALVEGYYFVTGLKRP